MIQLTIIRIEGYGPWTVTLGNDREAQLQMLQAKIYHDVQRLFSAKDGIVFFNRFDEYFAITNGLGAGDHREIQSELAKTYKDLSMSMAIGAGNVWDAYFAGRAAPLGRDVPPEVPSALLPYTTISYGDRCGRGLDWIFSGAAADASGHRFPARG